MYRSRNRSSLCSASTLAYTSIPVFLTLTRLANSRRLSPSFCTRFLNSLRPRQSLLKTPKALSRCSKSARNVESDLTGAPVSTQWVRREIRWVHDRLGRQAMHWWLESPSSASSLPLPRSATSIGPNSDKRWTESYQVSRRHCWRYDFAGRWPPDRTLAWPPPTILFSVLDSSFRRITARSQ